MNWVRFVKVFFAIMALGTVVWTVLSFVAKPSGSATVPYHKAEGSVTTVDDNTDQPSDHPDALMILIGPMDSRDFARVIDTATRHGIRRIMCVESGSNADALPVRDLVALREEPYDAVTDRSAFARIMQRAATVARHTNPKHIYFIGSPRRFDTLRQRSSEPTIADTTTMEAIAVDRRSIVFFRQRTKGDWIMRSLMVNIKTYNDHIVNVELQ
jgi:hypothetical protein